MVQMELLSEQLFFIMIDRRSLLQQYEMEDKK